MRFTIAITSARSVATGFPHKVGNGGVELMPSTVPTAVAPTSQTSRVYAGLRPAATSSA
ncbi:hypothetical protein NWFMUON74_12240 [Nocardia wallacei]|uniref:Uncharacterized protein n=1 Tax=Nocardia wallacei TaxID=480035 RepID=A0A7G1KDX0_9NOCA|nr:hypothetical protein NWFMUON74_12240 [Nocardia wallacei]